jgi:transglutaminase-like putative cysteine protease
MNLSVEHRLSFQYDGYISESHLELRVQPKTTAHQTVHTFGLSVGPPSRVARYVDWNENLVHHFSITRYHDRIEVLSRSTVSTHPASPSLAGLTDAPAAGEAPHHVHDFLAFGGPVRLTPLLRRFQRGLTLPRGAPLGERVTRAAAHLHGQFAYRKEVTRYDSTTEDFLQAGAGVCQDFAHLMLASLRLLRIPARYVSGYLHLESPANEPAQSHAWIEFWAPGHGWVPFDPTHNREVDERYVVVGHGRHYDDVPPNRGIYRGNARETLRAEVRTRLTAQRLPPTREESVQPLEVPVFKEIPERRRDPDFVVAEEAVQQQQQQQQRPPPGT